VTEDKLLAGPILAFVGGIVVLVYGVYEWYQGSTAQSLASVVGFPVGSAGGAVAGGIAGVVFGIIIAVSAAFAAIYPDYHASLGAWLLLLGLFSLVSLGGGNGVGFLLVVLGGTACMVYGPVDAERATAPSARRGEPPKPAYGYTCPACANLVSPDAWACERCGKLMPRRNKPEESESAPDA